MRPTLREEMDEIRRTPLRRWNDPIFCLWVAMWCLLGAAVLHLIAAIGRAVTG